MEEDPYDDVLKGEDLMRQSLKYCPTPIEYEKIKTITIEDDEFGHPTPELFKHFLEPGELGLAYDVLLSYGIKVGANKSFWKIILEAGEHIKAFENFSEVKRLMAGESQIEKKICFGCDLLSDDRVTSELVWSSSRKACLAYYYTDEKSTRIQDLLADEKSLYAVYQQLPDPKPLDEISETLKTPFVLKNSPEEFKRFLYLHQYQVAKEILKSLGEQQNAGEEFKKAFAALS